MGFVIADKTAKVASNQALRYAIACTIAVCIAALIAHYFLTSTQLIFYFVFSAGISVYYASGENWWQQSLTIIECSLLTAMVCLFAIMISPYTIGIGIYLFAICFLVYYLSTFNISYFLLSKLSIAALAFVMFSGSAPTWVYASTVFLYFLFGSLIALVANLIVVSFITHKEWRHVQKEWLHAVSATLQKASSDQGVIATDQLKQLTGQFKTSLMTSDLKLAHTVDRTSHALIKLLALMADAPVIKKEFGDDLSQLYLLALQSIKSKNSYFIQNGYKLLREHIFKLKEQGYFPSLTFKQRSCYAEVFFLIEKFTVDLTVYLEYGKDNLPYLTERQDVKLSAPESKLLCFIKLLNKVGVVTRSHYVSSLKIALRAAITITFSYVFAIAIKAPYPAWIVLTAGLVLLVKKGHIIKKGFDRVVGHVLGFCIALPMGLYVWVYFHSPFFWVPILIIITTYFFLKNYLVYGIFFVLLVLYLYEITSPAGFSHFDVLPFLTWRVVEIIAGSLIAILGGLLIFPNVGVRSLKSAMRALWICCANYIDQLKLSCQQDKDAQELLPAQSDLAASVLAYFQELQSLKFEPRRFVDHYELKLSLFNLSDYMVANLAALTRRMFMADNHFTQNQSLTNDIVCLLGILSDNLRSCVEQLETPSSKRSFCTMALDDVKKKAFAAIDSGEISYDELIGYLGVVHGIQSVDRNIKQIYLEVHQSLTPLRA